MMNKNIQNNFMKVFEGSKKPLILTHDNPDPDSISSAIALKFLLYKVMGIKSKVAYGGIIGRAENRAMVRLLKLRMYPFSKIKVKYYDAVALVDTQPDTGYHSLPKGVPLTLVIDHHPLRKTTKAKHIDVRSNIGATATILTEYLLKSGLEIPVNLATALFYGISSETRALGREASQEDINAYLSLFPKINNRLFSEIEHPKLPREYFDILKKAIQNARCYRNIIWSSLGDVDTPDFVAQIADKLLMHERITWSLSMGRFDEQLWISLRTTNIKAKAGKLAKRLVGKMGKSGGHDMVAGGQVVCKGMSVHGYEELEKNIVRRLLHSLGHNEEVEGKPLLKNVV
jgi:nanoRNase/pAp phosphatase (c-di-AMP/oligoRNAs hydrolase)